MFIFERPDASRGINAVGVSKGTSVRAREKHFRCYSVFRSHYLTLTQLDLLGRARTGASFLERLVTIPRMTFSMRPRTSVLDMTGERWRWHENIKRLNTKQYLCSISLIVYLQKHFSFLNESMHRIPLRQTNDHNLSWELASLCIHCG